MLVNIALWFLAISVGIGLRFSASSPFAHLFHFSPPVDPSFSSNCTILPAGYDHHDPKQPTFSFNPDHPIPAHLISPSDATFTSYLLQTPEISARKVAELIGLRTPGLPHRYHMYNEYGQQVFDARDCKRRHGYIYLLRRADLWTWPAISVGETVEVDSEDAQGNLKIFKLTTLATRPRVFEVQNFIDESERLVLLEMAKNPDAKSQLLYNKTISRLEIRLTSLLRLPRLMTTSDSLEFKKFEKGQGMPAKSEHITEDPDRSLYLRFNRNYFVTVIYVLEQAETGGKTNFPLVGADSPNLKGGACKSGLSVSPKPGSIIFYYHLDGKDNIAGVQDPWAVRAECEVESGTKWIGIRRYFNRVIPPLGVIAMDTSDLPYGYSYNFRILPSDE